MSIILIGAPEHLEALKQRDDFSAAQSFTDSEALRALEVITRRRPDVVALERLFAATARGTALINRIKADPKLAACEIRVVAHDSDDVRVIPPRTVAAPAAAASGSAPAPLAASVAAPVLAPSDQRGTRRAVRTVVAGGIDVTVDGNTAVLVNLSPLGAQVTSPTILRPNQRVRFVLSEEKRPIRLSAGVVWATFELVATGPQYRAGVEFFDADADTIQKFCDANKAS